MLIVNYDHRTGRNTQTHSKEPPPPRETRCCNIQPIAAMHREVCMVYVQVETGAKRLQELTANATLYSFAFDNSTPLCCVMSVTSKVVTLD